MTPAMKNALRLAAKRKDGTRVGDGLYNEGESRPYFTATAPVLLACFRAGLLLRRIERFGSCGLQKRTRWVLTEAGRAALEAN
jgi:hypothetical protein